MARLSPPSAQSAQSFDDGPEVISRKSAQAPSDFLEPERSASRLRGPFPRGARGRRTEHIDGCGQRGETACHKSDQDRERGKNLIVPVCRVLCVVAMCLAGSGGLQAASPAASTRSSPQQQTAAAQWRREVYDKLTRLKLVPRGFWRGGTAVVQFSIDSRGNIVGARIARSSGEAGLDKAALAMTVLASPVPPPPEGLGGGGVNFLVPIRYHPIW